MGKDLKISKSIKCCCCGKFISYESFEKDEVRIEFTPDSDRSVETIEYICKNCQKENNET